jgi:hypothetical protein
MATVNQSEFLKKLGYTGDPSTLTTQEAAGLIDRLKLQADDAKETAKRNANIVQMAEQRVELRKNGKQYTGPCPKCGGDNRFYCESDFFACRKCHPKRGDAIEYVMWLDGLTYDDALIKLGGPLPTTPAVDKVRPVTKAPIRNQSWNEPEKRRIAIDAHLSLVKGTTKQAQVAMAYLQRRCIGMETIKAFDVGYTAKYLPRAYDYESQKQTYPKQVAVTLPWFDSNGALVSIKYRFIEKHNYTDLDGKARTGENKTSEAGNQQHGNLFGWQCLQGPDKRQVLIICEGEINDLSLWQVGNHVIDVLSAGPEGQIANLPTAAVDLAQQYKHVIVWADERGIADRAAKRIGAAAMESPKSAEYPKGADANDMLIAGALGDWLSFAMGQLGVDVPPLPAVAPTTSHTPTYSNTLLIKDAQPLDFNSEPEQPAVDKVAAMAEQLSAIAALPSFDERLDALEPLHAAIGALTYTEVRDPSIAAELLRIFKKQSSVDAFLNKYGSKTPPTVASFDLSFDTPPTPPTAEPLQPDQLAYYQQYVGQTVSDEQMTGLYLSAHRHGFRLTSNPHGGMGCDHTVTGARFW